MDIKTLRSSFWFRPFQFEGTAMHANILLMCKLLVLLVVAHHIFIKIGDPFLPFIDALDYFNEFPGVLKYSLRALFAVGVFLLLFNYFVRTAAILLGSIIIFNIVISIPDFYNHTLICGCALFLAGLTNNQNPPYLLIIQLSLVYIGASANKFIDPDWWSGAFMHNWLAEARENPFYLTVSKWMPELILAKILSWFAMFSELLIGCLLLVKKYRRFAVWTILIFHGLLFTLTASRFGHFVESLFIILIAFLSIPKENLQIASNLNRIKKLVSFFDWDNKLRWNKLDSKAWLELRTETGQLKNHAAFKKILLSLPSFFCVLFAIDVLLILLTEELREVRYLINLVFMWTAIVYFFPFTRSKN